MHYDVRDRPQEMAIFEDSVSSGERAGASDGEDVHAIENYFWGVRGGVVLELGALDGTPDVSSMSHVFSDKLGWSRLLVEGNPKYNDVLKSAKHSIAVNAAICERH